MISNTFLCLRWSYYNVIQIFCQTIFFPFLNSKYIFKKLRNIFIFLGLSFYHCRPLIVALMPVSSHCEIFTQCVGKKVEKKNVFHWSTLVLKYRLNTQHALWRVQPQVRHSLSPGQAVSLQTTSCRLINGVEDEDWSFDRNSLRFKMKS